MKTTKKLQQTQKAINMFIKQTIKNYKSMKSKITKIWVILLFGIITLNSCNVTRVTSNESKYFQRGDTTVTIQTKVIETYDATKKL